jgi:LmbE family N-acetylglucosaminyl deacetylase
MRTVVSFLVAAASAIALGAQPAVPVHDRGAAGAWQAIRKLTTTASVMHTTAHPDDEHGGMLALLSRGQGAHVSLLTLTRGESGDNALGPELFDALGLLRTEELLAAGRYYGVDRQYFTSAVDYGFSKRLDEALEKWGREHVLRDMVRIIRTERPLVLVSRFQGTGRDGHGNHQAAGLLTRNAFDLAGDPAAFADQIESGLRPWQPLKLYIGGVREAEDWHVRLDTGVWDPVLGDSYHALGRRGLALQRSQHAGQVAAAPGPALAYYRRVAIAAGMEPPAKERSFFDGIDTTLPGLFRAVRRQPPAGAIDALVRLDREIAAAVSSFSFTEPSRAVPALARALGAARAALTLLEEEEEAKRAIQIKEQQIRDAISAAMGISLIAIAQPVASAPGRGAFGGVPPAMGPAVPDRPFEVRAQFVNPGPLEVSRVRLELAGPASWVPVDKPGTGASENRSVEGTFRVTLRDEAIGRPAFHRRSLLESRYAFADATGVALPAGAPMLEIVATCEVAGVTVQLRRPVQRVDPDPPRGFALRELTAVPRLSVALNPQHAIARLGSSTAIGLTADVVTSDTAPVEGVLRLNLPAGWTAAPSEHRFALGRAGERAAFRFDVRPPAVGRQARTDGARAEARIEAVAETDGREFREGFTTIRYPGLDAREFYRAASTIVRDVDVRVAPGLRVGYVMGVGDEVPAAIAQLGAEVEPLDAQALAAADLSAYNAIVLGTRAYAVRNDLRTYNRRLLEYVAAGGNLIVLYNTQELVPSLFSPFPGELPPTAEEVSEEDAPVEILAPDAAVLTTPNRITAADFEGWIEQRGSKFWTSWDARYTPIVASRDTGQAPQKGGWLHARHGKGHYTYFAYALHRQLPYGVPGAYRLLANLLSLGSR